MSSKSKGCEFVQFGGNRSNDECARGTKFLVFNERDGETLGLRVCGRHVSPAIEGASRENARNVTVRPDFYRER